MLIIRCGKSQIQVNIGFMNVEFIQPEQSEGDALADLRVAAMKDSLEAAGRFDPARARERFLAVFSPDTTWKIVQRGKVAGFYSLKTESDHLWLNDLYIDSVSQSSGIGSIVIERVKRQAETSGLPIRLGALRGSMANAFYLHHGFLPTHEDAWDIYYEYSSGH